ncbi:AraC family transcriptional regulator [Paenibacillaceae bacterium]|nr:AraC family transcriptional regulator [Paenibacillaceae bacterium]
MKLINEQIIQNYLQQFHSEVTLAAYAEDGPGWREESFIPDFFRLCLIERGTAFVEIDGQSYVARQGQLVFLPAGVRQAISNCGEENYGRYWCHFRINAGDMKLFEALELPFSIPVVSVETVRQLFSKIITALSQDSFVSALRVRGAFLELISYYFERCTLREEALGQGESYRKLKDVFAYIEAHLDQVIHIEELAKVAYLHPNYFIEFFKGMVGSPPIHYINQLKLERAKQLLESSDDYVARIAMQVGMQNHYLSRLFKQYTGMSPSRYRQIYRRKVWSTVE